MYKQEKWGNFMIHDINTNGVELIRELTGENYYTKIKRGEQIMLRQLKDGEVYVLDTNEIFDTVTIRTRFYKNGNSTIAIPREVFNALSLLFRYINHGYVDTDILSWYPIHQYCMNDVNCINEIYSRRKHEIKKVIFNEPATIVFWGDGTKTVVKCSKDDEFDPEKGLAMDIAKKFFGNENGYSKNIKKWTDTYKDEDEDEDAAATSINTGASGVGNSFADAMTTVLNDIFKNMFEVHSPSKTIMGDMNKNTEKKSKEDKE